MHWTNSGATVPVTLMTSSWQWQTEYKKKGCHRVFPVLPGRKPQSNVVLASIMSVAPMLSLPLFPRGEEESTWPNWLRLCSHISTDEIPGGAVASSPSVE